VRSGRDIQDRRGNTEVLFDADTGEMRLLLLPTGQYAGNTVTSWLYALHEANVFGMSYRIFVCVLGLMITMLSVTGVYIWWKKRRARKFSTSRRAKEAEARMRLLPLVFYCCVQKVRRRASKMAR
jgi:uncharacterized iron-regulated membrane protein